MHSFHHLGLAAACAVLALGGACTSEVPTSDCGEEPVDTFNELMVVDEDVLSDPRSKNATNGPWSFRYVIENMTPAHMEPGEFVKTWLTDWVTRKTLNGFLLDRPGEEREVGMRTRLLCPWLKRTPSNACDDACLSCAAEKLDLAVAPFRLIAIVNRMDLRDEIEGSPSGEGRLVFAGTDGPGDDPASPALAMTLIVEYRLPDSRSPREWAQTWHALGKFSDHGEPYRQALQEVTDSFVKRNADPNRINGSALGQIRTNEATFNWIWQSRQFELDARGMLTLAPLRNTPGEELNNTPALREFVEANAQAIASKRYELTPSLRAGSSNNLLFHWEVPGVDPATRRAFAVGTCNGCHGSEETRIVEFVFHVSPYKRGREKLSKFVYDPSADKDDLRARTASYRRALCGN